MSDLVERLAEKRERFPRYAVIAGVDTEEVRWWLRAVADEVRGEAELRKTPGNFAGHFCTVSEWLRAQANDNEEGSDGG